MVNLLNVFINIESQRLNVGRLAIDNKRILFEYHEAFLKSPLPLSPFKLPVKSGVFIEETNIFNGLFGLFDDSLPDGWGKLLIDRLLRSKGIDYQNISPLDRLAFVGKKGMGALEYEPEAVDNNLSNNILNLDKLADEAEKIYDGEIENLDELAKLNGSSMGARAKIVALVSKDKKTIKKGDISNDDNFEPWLIKFPTSDEGKNFGADEFLWSEQARKAGINMSETYLFPSAVCAGYFGTKRFDRAGRDKFHISTISGLIHANFRQMNLDYDTIMKLAIVLTKDIREVIKIFQLMVFNVKLGNRDDHSKNFSFIMNKNGTWRFAPPYDITKSKGINSEHATTVHGKGKDITTNDMLAVGEKFNIPEKTMNKIIADIENVLE